MSTVQHPVIEAMGVARQQVPDLHRSSWEPRALRNSLLTTGAWVAAILASVPLFSVLYMLIMRGGSRLTWEALVVVSGLHGAL